MRFERVLYATAAVCIGILFDPSIHASELKLTDCSELAELFSAFCIQDFPDPAETEKFIRLKGAREMSAKEVASYLHSDPGRGWYLKTPAALYAITLEEPPYHTCAIRRMTPAGEDGTAVKAIAEAVKAYSSEAGGHLVDIKPRNTELAPGLKVYFYGSNIVNAAQQTTDSFGVFISTYARQVPDPWRPDAASDGGVEVRFSHLVAGR